MKKMYWQFSRPSYNCIGETGERKWAGWLKNNKSLPMRHMVIKVDKSINNKNEHIKKFII